MQCKVFISQHGLLLSKDEPVKLEDAVNKFLIEWGEHIAAHRGDFKILQSQSGEKVTVIIFY